MGRAGSISAAVVAALVAATAGSGRPAATGTLDLNAPLVLTSLLGACAAVGTADECAARTISGQFPGLGSVAGSYSFLLHHGDPCTSDAGRALTYPIRISVAGKGEIVLSVAAALECVNAELIRTQTQQFAVTGGTGVYAGASGSGRLERLLGEPTSSGARHGRETWTGTLVVPGLDFDLTPPAFAGAKNVTVAAPKGARTARVVYRVTAADDREGAVPATCTPKPGTRFAIGRATVTCEAVDGSGNTATAKFVVRVRP